MPSLAVWSDVHRARWHLVATSLFSVAAREYSRPFCALFGVATISTFLLVDQMEKYFSNCFEWLSPTSVAWQLSSLHSVPDYSDFCTHRIHTSVATCLRMIGSIS